MPESRNLIIVGSDEGVAHVAESEGCGNDARAKIIGSLIRIAGVAVHGYVIRWCFTSSRPVFVPQVPGPPKPLCDAKRSLVLPAPMSLLSCSFSARMAS